MTTPDEGVPTQPIQVDEIRPELLARFGPQFEACLSLHRYLRAQRPSAPPTSDPAGVIILWTFARSTKTFQGSLRLAGLGYGEQAAMLNRSLYEDMLIAHWVRRHPAEAAERIEEHQRFTLAKWGNVLRRNKLTPAGAKYPHLTKDERFRLGKRFRGKTWTGLNLPDLLLDVRDEWPSGQDRALLIQVNDVVHQFNNLLLHHSAQALAVLGRYDADENAVTFDVGPSTRHIHGSLLGAFFSYGNTASLVDKSPELNKVFAEGMLAFTSARDAQ